MPRDIVLDRLAGRRVCESCQRVYHVNLPPVVDWTCDTCGGDVVQRDDDTEEAIDRRLQLYEEQTVPIIDYYRDRGMLAQVSGVGEGDDVFKRLVKVVDARRCAVTTSGPAQVAGRRSRVMRRAGRVVAEMHEACTLAAKPGATTADLDAAARDVLDRRGARSNFLGYHGFPGGRVHLAQRGDRARHPRATG